jgi:hypothetical protein
MTSNTDLTALEAAEREATPGPWFAYDDNGDDEHPPHVDSDAAGLICTATADADHATPKGCMGSRDVRFIAAIRNAAPELLAEVRRLREENDRLNRVIERYVR